MIKHCYDAPMQADFSVKDILDFYIEAGVDEVIADHPVNQFDLPKPQPSTPIASPSAPARAPLSATTPLKKMTSASISLNTAEKIEKAQSLASSANSLEDLQKALQEFEGSALKGTATNTVFGWGNPSANLMLIDRQPNAEEDRSGAPFAGENGILLRKMMAAIGVEENEIYCAASIPWRPPGGQIPTKEEQSLCRPFIQRHMELVKPRHIVAFGEAAAFILQKNVGINKLRGKWEGLTVESIEIPVLPLFHPTFLMEYPSSKKLAWADLLNLKSTLAETPS
jgi:uracil-DNA glycosylase